MARKMRRLRFNGVLEIPEDTFAGEFDSDTDCLLVHAFEHGDASGDFFTYTRDGVTIEDYYEETE
ncbi:hypothetical protein [Streptomyces sp. NPDC006355]|uniref:hypothetical protein n=1 Tax=Streptomyces sp. NPDC006355 TaxID=3156758 RepID=UPI0033A29EBB